MIVYLFKIVKNISKKDKINSHYGDVIMGAIASQIASLTIVYSTVYADADQRKHQSSASPAFVRGIHRFPAQMASNAEMFPFDVIMVYYVVHHAIPCSSGPRSCRHGPFSGTG